MGGEFVIDVVINKSKQYRDLYEMEKTTDKLSNPNLHEIKLKKYYKFGKTFVFLGDNTGISNIKRVLTLFGQEDINVIVFTNSNKLINDLTNLIQDYNSIMDDNLLIRLFIRENK